jgi:hypothetical protein
VRDVRDRCERGDVMMAMVRDRFTEMAVDCGLGIAVLALVFFTLLNLFRRNRKDGDASNDSRDSPEI